MRTNAILKATHTDTLSLLFTSIERLMLRSISDLFVVFFFPLYTHTWRRYAVVLGNSLLLPGLEPSLALVRWRGSRGGRREWTNGAQAFMLLISKRDGFFSRIVMMILSTYCFSRRLNSFSCRSCCISCNQSLQQLGTETMKVEALV